MSAPTSTILQFSDIREGREGAPADRSRSLQCQKGEVHAPTGDFAVCYLLRFFSVVISIHVAWNFILIWLSIIFGLILCYFWVIYLRIVLYLLHAINH